MEYQEIQSPLLDGDSLGAINLSQLSIVQSPLHKGDSDKQELLFMGTGLWGQISMHVIFIYDKKDIFFLKVSFYILSSSQKLFQRNKCYIYDNLQKVVPVLAPWTPAVYVLFGCLGVLLSLAKDTDT